MHKNIFFSVFVALSLYGARPLVTDDARLTNAYSCQLESYTKHTSFVNDFWLLPACNPTGNLEFTLGLGRSDNQSNTFDNISLQAKTLFHPLQANGYGIGIAAGVTTNTITDAYQNQIGSFYGYIPVSFSLHNDQIILHLNGGMIHDTQSYNTFGTYGIGSEITINEHLFGVAEIYGDTTGELFWQGGSRLWLIPNKLQMDMTYGAGGKDFHQWVTFGLRILGSEWFRH